MVAWTNAKKPASSSANINRLKVDTEVKIRLVGEVLPRYVYWVTTKEGKPNSVECLSFDRETQSFTDSPDPIKEIPDGVYTDRPQFSYVAQAIDRKDGNLKLFDMRSTIYKAIVDLANNPEYGNPADPEKGYDIYIKKEKTGPLPMNVKYVVTAGRSSTPLSKAELEMELFNLEQLYRRPSYGEQKKWLYDNTLYFVGTDDESRPSESVDDLKA